MKFSTFHIMSCPPPRACGEVIADALREVVLSEDLGFDNVWFTEHHGTDYGLSASPSVMGAAAAMRTRRCGIGYAVNVTPLHHPLRLAEEIALVDHLSQGRLIVGFGAGYSPVEYGLYGVDFDERHERHREAVEIVSEAWGKDRFDYDGRHFQLRDAHIALRPKQDPHPPLAFTANRVEAIEAIARRGARLLVLGSLEQVRTRIGAYARALRESGQAEARRQECLANAGVLRHVYVTRDPERGRSRVVEASRWHVGKLQQMAPAPSGGGPSEQEVEQYVEDRVIIGRPEEVAERIAELKAAAVGELLGWFKWGELTHEEAAASMKLFAEEVMPRVG